MFCYKLQYIRQCDEYLDIETGKTGDNNSNCAKGRRSHAGVSNIEMFDLAMYAAATAPTGGGKSHQDPRQQHNSADINYIRFDDNNSGRGGMAELPSLVIMHGCFFYI